MKKLITLATLTTALLTLPNANINAEPTNENKEETNQEVTKKEIKPFFSFTGKVTKNKVRMRLQPSLDSPILKQLDQGDMVIVVGEDDDFFAVQAPEDMRAFIFRTYVLDGVVEGHHVNVRLDPVLDSPVIAQLNSGDAITGRISPLNSKWLEIIPPKSTKFYVSKDYLKKVGDPSYLAKINKRRDTVNQLLDSAYNASQLSQETPFPEIDYEDIVSKYQRVVNEYPDFENQASRAKELLVNFKDDYTKKKIAHLESKSKEFQNAESLQKENSRLSKAMQQQQHRLRELETRVNTQEAPVLQTEIISVWAPHEEIAYKHWLSENEGGTMEDFYISENENASTLRGRVEPYNRNIKNKPGDYLLVNDHNAPLAFIYSTKVNLQDFVGAEITVNASRRPNNNFAYPAFYVLTIQ